MWSAHCVIVDGKVYTFISGTVVKAILCSWRNRTVTSGTYTSERVYSSLLYVAKLLL